MKETKKWLRERLASERNFSHSLYEEIRELRKKVYEPMTHDEQMKEIAVGFGKFLITMRVTSVDYPNTFKTNSGMAPDMLVETMEQLYDRHLDAKRTL